MAVALRLLLRQHAAAPPSPMLRSLFPAPYSKAAAAAASSLPAAGGAPLPPPRLRVVTPRKAPPTPNGEPRCCTTVPSTMTDSTKSWPDKLKDLKDSKKSLQDMKRNIEEHEEMIRKALDERKVAVAFFRKQMDDRHKLISRIKDARDDCVKTHNICDKFAKILDMKDDLAKVDKMQVDYDKDWAIQEAKDRLLHEQIGMLLEKRKDHLGAWRRYHELERSTMEPLEKLKKAAKVGAAVGLVGGLLLILAKI